MVGRRGPRGRSVIAEMVQGPHRERRTRARALGTLTTWGDGEWVVVGRGLPGIAVAALRSPTSRCGVHLRRSAGWSLRIVRGQVWGAASEAIRGRGERLESGARCWNSRLIDGSGCTPGAVWGGGHVVAVGCSSPHLAVPLWAAGTPPSGSKISDTTPDRESGPGGCAADGSPGVNAALGRGTTAGASSGERHRGGPAVSADGAAGWVGRLQVDQHDRRGPCRSEPARRARAGRSSGSAQRRRDDTATVVTRTRRHACVRTTPPPGRHIVTTTTEAVPRGAVAAKVRCPIPVT